MALLAHRGPDGAGSWRDGRCELVHRRLALLDLTPTGHQPMTNETGDVWITFNGEIYNHVELRHELEQRGHTFRGTSDTEVLVHLYEDRDAAMVERLRGIFAFALYDKRRAQLILARDRFGVKPLFHARHEGQWVFASEIKAITALPGFRPQLDRQACYDYLGLGYIPEPATGFANVHALPKGCVLRITPDAYWLTPYHALAARPDVGRTLEESTDIAAGQLEDAVRRQSAADVPVAALLSGGIDSSLVVAARQRATGDATTTFNVRFPDESHDETGLALSVAARYGTTHHTIDLADHALNADTIVDLLRHFDQPFADTSFIPMYWVSAAVRERGIICTLSGDGGDEAFGGYSRFWRANRLWQLMAAPSWLRTAARRAGESLAPFTRNFGRQMAKAVQLAEAGRSDTAPLMAGLSSYLTEAQKATLVLPEAREALHSGDRHFNGYVPTSGGDLEELSRRITETLFEIGLPSDMLRKVDMMSMRASIEVRVPMLDEALVDGALTLPHRLKTDGRNGKLVLRELARRWLPPEVAGHPKHGFMIPLDVMAPAGLHDVMVDVLCGSDSRTRPILDVGQVRAALAAFAAARTSPRGGTVSREGVYHRVLSLLSLELFLRDHGLSW